MEKYTIVPEISMIKLPTRYEEGATREQFTAACYAQVKEERMQGVGNIITDVEAIVQGSGGNIDSISELEGTIKATLSEGSFNSVKSLQGVSAVASGHAIAPTDKFEGYLVTHVMHYGPKN